MIISAYHDGAKLGDWWGVFGCYDDFSEQTSKIMT